MTIKIGSARIDERGKASGGKSGDNSGREVSTQTYYKHKKGWYVLRPKTATQANKVAQDMKWACNNSHIGYDQGQRLTLYNVAEKVGFNCSKVTTNCETDCSALVRVCLAYAGIDTPNFRTTTERKDLLATGQFTDVTNKVNLSTGKGLCIGDVLVTRSQGHTVVVVSGATKRSDTSYIHVIKNARVGEFQSAYNISYGGDLAIDNTLGPKTKAAVKTVLLKKGDYTHTSMIKFVQEYVGADIDGKYGSKTAQAVKTYQEKHGLTADGEAGPKTITSILENA